MRKNEFKSILDKELCLLNDDYKTERTAALKEVFIEQLPVSTFYKFLDSIGKKGAQIKFPRVMKGEILQKWIDFLN